MRNVVSSAIQELLSFTPGHCHACHELHEELKAALMQYLLSSTNLYAHGLETGAIQMNAVEVRLTDALAEFHAHRLDTHFMSYFTVSRMEMAVRNAS
ncbi:MAG: hypothetical protein ROO76_05445 [Terriglobia bacterium]|nr:hypothetical protein [Terriglobia bacterium]